GRARAIAALSCSLRPPPRGGLHRVLQHPEPGLVRPRQRPFQRGGGVIAPQEVDLGPRPKRDQNRVSRLVLWPRPMRRRPPPLHQLAPSPSPSPSPSGGRRQAELGRAASRHVLPNFSAPPRPGCSRR